MLCYTKRIMIGMKRKWREGGFLGEAVLCSFRDFGRLEDGEGVAYIDTLLTLSIAV